MSLIVNSVFKKINPSNQLKSSTTINQTELVFSLCKQLCPVLNQHQQIRNAGHSKWQNIRHTKAAKDGERSKFFNKIAMQITRTALNGTDPKLNKELSNLLNYCKENNVSKDLIDRAIGRAKTQKLQIGSKGFLGPNEVVGIADFLYDPRFKRPSEFLKPIHRTYKEYRFVDAKTLLCHFDRKGIILVHKYDKNSNPVPFEKIEDAAIESEAEEIEITCEEDKQIPPLPVEEEEDNRNKKRAAQTLNDDIEDDSAFYWRLITSEENLYTSKGHIEKNYPDLVIKEATIEYTAKELIKLNEKDMETFTKFYDDLTDIEEFEKIYSNVRLNQ